MTALLVLAALALVWIAAVVLLAFALCRAAALGDRQTVYGPHGTERGQS